MKKFFNYAVALLVCASVSFTSCKDDDDPKDNGKKQEIYTPANPETLGQQSQSIVSKLGDGSETSLVLALNSLSESDATQAAKTIFEYYKNKKNNAWVESFVKAAATQNMSSERVKALLDEAVAKMEAMNFLNEKVTVDELIVALDGLRKKEIPSATDSIPSVSDAQIEGAKYEQFFERKHDWVMNVDPNGGLDAAAAAYIQLSEIEQAELIKAVKTYNAGKSDAKWVEDFVGTIAYKYPAEEVAHVKALFEAFGPMVDMMP